MADRLFSGLPRYEAASHLRLLALGCTVLEITPPSDAPSAQSPSDLGNCTIAVLLAGLVVLLIYLIGY